jgi:hypothetical protein
VTRSGLPEVGSAIESFLSSRETAILEKRNNQNIDWMWALIFEGLKISFHETVSETEIEKVKSLVMSHKLTAPIAAEKLLKLFRK